MMIPRTYCVDENPESMIDETIHCDPPIVLWNLEKVLECGAGSTVISVFGHVTPRKDPFLETIGTETWLGQVVVSDHRRMEYVFCFLARW